MSAPKPHYFSYAFPLALAALAWSLGFLGLFQGTDGALYDAFMRLKCRFIREPSQVLLVPVQKEALRSQDDSLIALIDRLKRFGARSVVFNFCPDWADSGFYESAAASGNVILGITAKPDPLNPSQLLLGPHPNLERYSGLRVGIVSSPPATGGICRAQFARIEASGLRFAALEAKAAEQSPGEQADELPERYMVNFRGGSGSLPNVDLPRLLSGDVTDDLVQGKGVIVGLEQSDIGAGFHTPTTAGQEVMSLLEFEGQALNTLLCASRIRELGNLARLWAVCAAVLICVWVYRLTSLRMSFWATGGIFIFFLAASGSAFVVWRVWLPISELSMTLCGFFLFTVRHRALQLSTSVGNLIADSASHLRDKYWPVNLHGTATSWSLVANMINQTLDLKRLIFLEVDPRTYRLREILALHCSMRDIPEACKDFGHPLYRDATEAKGPIVVENYLRTADKNEKQYLSPLSFCGELLGFWAIGIDNVKIAATPDFDNLLVDYTNRISELLHNAKEGDPHGADGSLTTSSKRRSDPQSNLSATLTLLQQRLGALDVLINSLNSGIIVFDIFGRIIQINEVMLSLLKKESLVPFEMTALDIIMALSDYDVSKARKILRRVIVESSQVSFPVAFRSLPGNRYLINLKPLLESNKREEKSRVRQIGARSILCELVDTTSMAIMYEMKNRLTDRLCCQLRNDLAPIQLSWSLITDAAVEKPDLEVLSEAVHSKIQQTIQAISECQQYLAVDADLDDLERFPVDPKEPLRSALEEIRVELKNTTLSFQVIEPNFISYVFASTNKLRETCRAILSVLCQDAAENSAIIVRVSERDDIVAFDFSNMGFGIPNDLLQQNVFGKQSVAAADLQLVQTSVKWVQAWGGMFECFSGVGVGMHFTIHLVKFI